MHHIYILPASLEKSGSRVGFNQHEGGTWNPILMGEKNKKKKAKGQNKRWKENLSFEMILVGAPYSFNPYSKGASSPSTCLVSWGCDFILFLRSLKCLQQC